MKRILAVILIFIAGAVAFQWAQSRERSLSQIAQTLESEQRGCEANLAMALVQQTALRDALARPATPSSAEPSEQFSAGLTAWLVAGDFSTIPLAMVRELRAALGLAEDTTSDYVLISKPTMEMLRPRSPDKKDKLSEGMCGLLSIGPEQKSQIESALSGARKEFADWGKQNVVRDTPGGETLVRYTLPATTDFADAVTNRLLTTISDAIGQQRASLFRTYAEDWFQIEMGYLGGVTNTLEVLKKPDENGQQSLYYELSRKGLQSSMSEGPGKINARWFPPAWRNIFPGGWPEVAEREGLELPPDPKKAVK